MLKNTEIFEFAVRDGWPGFIYIFYKWLGRKIYKTIGYSHQGNITNLQIFGKVLTQDEIGAIYRRVV